LQEPPTVSWPVSQDYNEAIQDPAASFGDADLRAAEPVTNALGLPVPCSGNFADVYQLRHPDTGACWAIKCFTRLVAGRRERYEEVSRHLGRARLPFTVDFVYLEEGIRVRGQWFPVVKMQWVEGLLLNQFVRDNVSKPAMLEKLLELWSRMAVRLREADVAHGDLQHGNVLLVPGSTTAKLALKLIDYDGLFVPALAGRPTEEVGHGAYQHPLRQKGGGYGPDMDRIPLLLIATALRALVVAGPPLWKRFDNGDNLLFREADLRAPGESALFRELWQLPDPLTPVLAARLALACQQSMDRAPMLGELLAEDLLPVLSVEQQDEAEALLGGRGETGAAPAPSEFEELQLSRRRPQGVTPLFVAAWAAVALLLSAVIVAVPIVWSVTAAPPTTRKGSGTGAPLPGVKENSKGHEFESGRTSMAPGP
jgi:hypothetical protein